MSLLSAVEMASIRSLAESGLKDTISIFRRVRTETADGWVESWPDTADETVLGWLYEQTSIGTEIGVIAGALGAAEQSWLRMAVGTVIASGDRVTINGVRFTVEHTTDSNTYAPWVSCAVRTIS